MGTAESVTANEIAVGTKNGGTVSILLTKDTTYRYVSEGAAKGVDLRPGSRVVVDVTAEGYTLTAIEVRFSSAGRKT